MKTLPHTRTVVFTNYHLSVTPDTSHFSQANVDQAVTKLFYKIPGELAGMAVKNTGEMKENSLPHIKK